MVIRRMEAVVSIPTAIQFLESDQTISNNATKLLFSCSLLSTLHEDMEVDVEDDQVTYSPTNMIIMLHLV